MTKTQDQIKSKLEQLKLDIKTYEHFIGNVMVTPYMLNNFKWLIETVEESLDRTEGNRNSEPTQ
jgi:hypothetical protein